MRNGLTSLKIDMQGIRYAALAAMFVFAQLLISFHHHSDAHADEHDFVVECDICTIAPGALDAPTVSHSLEAPKPEALALPPSALNAAKSSIARSGGPRAPPQTL
ncbi:MAG: hypothetical protein JJ850_02755 [Kordiimonadaceae bacterium]|nr:hypothetical protein [Kordiimonadaceae bacterium]MBO6567273.1 hypothetical protein [Kordiimonadaceae bacterium]MBO6963513.1 hypothetical protein [Kordiimonadaceae bacterium]